MSIEIKPSPIQNINFRGIDFAIKRDDLLNDHFSGNKARKFYYFLNNKFPNIKKIISHGSAQSNAMYSISVLAKMREWEFEYYTSHISSYLLENPHGNYQESLKNGMNIFTKDPPSKTSDDTIFIKEGGAMMEAEEGIRMLAQEINEVFKEKKIDIFLPSGTGTTALYLQKHLDHQVFTTPCVGDELYLKKQFLDLEEDECLHPTIIDTDKKYHFAKLYRDFFEIWIELKNETGIEFDMLYDPKGWLALLTHRSKFKNNILYIHQGGVLGNVSMLKRYKRKFNEDIK